MDSKEIVAYIEMNFDVTYSVSGVTALLHSMGFTYKKARPVPGKAKKEAQELFIEAYNRLKHKGGKIYFADSTNPHYNAVISYGRIKISMVLLISRIWTSSLAHVSGSMLTQSVIYCGPSGPRTLMVKESL